MKQGETRRKKPKDKHEKQSWKTRNEARKGKQELHALTVIANEEAAAQAIADLAAVEQHEQALLNDARFEVRTSDYFREEGDPLRALADQALEETK